MWYIDRLNDGGDEPFGLLSTGTRLACGSIRVGCPMPTRPLSLVTLVFAVIAFATGVIGFAKAFPDQSAASHVYHSMQLFALSFPQSIDDVSSWLQVARFLAPISLVAGFMTALLHFSRGLWHSIQLPFLRNHVVVTGMNPMVSHLVSDLRTNEGKKVVIVTRERDSEQLKACVRAGAIAIFGDSTDSNVLRVARPQRASHFVAFCEDQLVNLETAIQLLNLFHRKTKPLRRKNASHLVCHVCLHDPLLQTGLKSSDAFTRDDKDIVVHLFDLNEVAARKTLERHPLSLPPRRRIDSPPANPATQQEASDDHPRLIFLGFGEGAPAFLQHALSIGVYDQRTPLPVHIVAPAMAQLTQQLHELHLRDERPEFSLTHHEAASENVPDLLKHFETGTLKPREGDTLVCLNDTDDVNISLAIRLGRILPENAQVLVRTSRIRSSHSFVQNLHPSVHPFGFLDEQCSFESVTGNPIDLLARNLHGDYLSTGMRIDNVLHDNRSWAQLPEAKRDQNISQACHLPVKLRLLGLDPQTCTEKDVEEKIADPDILVALAKLEHERWNRTHLLSGYVYGEEKDDIRKTTPYLVPYDQLQPDIQQYDIDFIKGMPQLCALARELKPATE